MKTRDTASPGYKIRLAAIRRKTPGVVDPRVVEALKRQILARAREPEGAFTEVVVARQELEEVAAKESPDPLPVSIRAAIAYKHRGGDHPVRRVSDVT
ncbi:hypothetical protein OH809_44000 (plasmid) [Streptomyces sp. NBC_00873]|uniref:hypothetical protein n=1 Tax=unclassified Streptomyces TaxID=2593676 RepID=UPI002F908A6D|nr:hypothetical protein OH809_44000 [Streptomyces sp. NBC_00873]WTA49160.1 hypothetical protein OH821_44490 [Streptomyces sp. NBC_00842]